MGKANGGAFLDGGTIVLKEIEVEAALANCRALNASFSLTGVTVPSPIAGAGLPGLLLARAEL
jgi:hypothetical protein